MSENKLSSADILEAHAVAIERQPSFEPIGRTLEPLIVKACREGASALRAQGRETDELLRRLLVDCDSELSAIAHGRSFDKAELIRLSNECRRRYNLLPALSSTEPA